MFTYQVTLFSAIAVILAAMAVGLVFQVLYNIFFHPLSHFPGPWYAAVSSLFDAVMTFRRSEVPWFQNLVNKYGVDSPIRIAPNMLLFPRPSSLKDIYRDPKCNQRSKIYGTKALGMPNVFITLDANEHRALRKAISAGWTIGALRNTWESRISEQIGILIQQMRERAEARKVVRLSDRFSQFTADIMTMVSFGEPWGFVKNDRDERGIIQSFRAPLDYISFVSRWVLVRDYILTWSFVMKFVLPSPADQTGWGYLMGCAHRELAIREEQLQNGVFPEKVDFIQHCIDARIDGKPLSEDQKRAHITLLIQAGSDTTSNSLSAIFRLLVTNLDKLDRAYEEIRAADKAGKLSSIVKYDEARTHLPFTTACIKESMRLAPPASFLFARVTPKEGSIIDGVFIPGGTEVTTHHYIVHLDPKLYAPDPNTFRPERWLESPRVCLGKDLALMEMYKLVPEIIRRFVIELEDKGDLHITGQVAFIDGFTVKLTPRE